MSVVKNLFYKAGDFELNVPEWNFPDQGITALTGASGSGKTSLLKILCGLIPCAPFSWEFQGQDLARLPSPERGLGVCFQDLRLFPHLSVRENILFAIKAKGIPFKEKQKDFEDMTDFLELKKCLNLFIEDLSGGEKQRTALVRALIVRPRLLFLDEPFSYLDKAVRDKARQLSFGIVQKYAVPLLLVSHDREDIRDLSNQEFFLDQGRIYKNPDSYR